LSEGRDRGGRGDPAGLASWTREQLEEEVLALRDRLDLALDSRGPGALPDDWERFRTHLSTVSVPPEVAPAFLKAQEYVARYFSERVHRPDEATISIAGERYVLMRAASMSVEFVELVTSLYQDKGPAEARSVANNLLFDLAHAIGKADARRFHEKMGVTDPIERLSAGPIHFAFSGWAYVELFPESRPSPDDDYFMIFDHPFSFESHAWLAKGRTSEVPVCIMNAGYSSGWCEESFGMPLVSAEVECIAAGGAHCRFIMAPPSRIEEHLARHIAGTQGAAGAPSRHGARPAVAVPEFFQRRRLEDELRKGNELLEGRVLERTAELRHQALHDALTELPNRLLFYDRLEREILKCVRSSRPLGLLFMDLDGFKRVNDSHGHHCGDELLREVGARLVHRLRASDTVARLGGDEFGILLPDLAGPSAASEIAQELLRSLAEPFVIEGHRLIVGASIGIALCPEHGEDPATLLRRADVAMYAAKQSSSGHALFAEDGPPGPR
jgi:diguanylate cyclase (GGDEF)-like protein